MNDVVNALVEVRPVNQQALARAAMHELVDAIRERKALLFVGAGVSMNLGVPSWGELTAHMAERLGVDAEEFARMGDDQTLAEYYATQTGSLGPLRSWMDVEWHRDAAEKVRQSDIHRLIVELAFPMIYTTNYDRYLELAHEALGVPYTKVSNISEMAWAEAGVTQIVKFHGDFEDDGSIVLTESSHFERLSLDSPLDLKFQADLIGRVALFIGYSVSDVSVRYVLYRLHKLWQRSPYSHARPKTYVFLGQPNPVQAEVLGSWGIIPIFSESEAVGEGLRQLLESLVQQAYHTERTETSEEKPSAGDTAHRSGKGGRKPASSGK